MRTDSPWFSLSDNLYMQSPSSTWCSFASFCLRPRPCYHSRWHFHSCSRSRAGLNPLRTRTSSGSVRQCHDCCLVVVAPHRRVVIIIQRTTQCMGFDEFDGNLHCCVTDIGRLPLSEHCGCSQADLAKPRRQCSGDLGSPPTITPPIRTRRTVRHPRNTPVLLVRSRRYEPVTL